MEEKKNKHYLSGKEVRAIAKANAKEMRRLEKAKNRKCPKSEYTTELKNPDNILEVEDLHSYFFTDQGVVKAVNGVSFRHLDVDHASSARTYRADRFRIHPL